MIFGGNFEQVKRLIEFNENLAFDVETTGTNKRKDTVIGFGISGKDPDKSNRYVGYYICVYSWDASSNKLQPADNRAQTIEILELLKSKKLTTWNGAFDISITANSLGINLIDALHCDGMLLAHTVNENEFDYRLKGFGKRIFGASATDEEEELKAEVLALGGKWTQENKEMFKASPATLAKYCIADCVLTNQLVDHFLPKLAEQGLTEFFFEHETMPLYKHFTIPAENNGIRLDMPLLTTARQEIQQDIDQLEAKILAEINDKLGLFKAWLMAKNYPPSRTGAFAQGFCVVRGLDLPKTKSGAPSLTAKNISALPNGYEKQVLLQEERMKPEDVQAVQEYLWATDGKPWFNLQSKHHLKKLFFDTLKEEPLSRTPTGQPQADDEFLEVMAGKYSWANLLRTYNRLQKLKSTYMDRFLDAAEDGRFYPSFQQHRTSTGRLAGDLQQLPRPVESPQQSDIVAKYQNLIRAFFIADEGWTFVDDDYESAEPRVFAHVSNEQSLRNIFSAGHDFYSTICIATEALADFSADKKAPNYLGKLAKEKRQSAKVYSLGIPYGLTGYKLQYELNIPLKQAEALVAGYLAGFPNLHAEMKKAHQEVLQNGFVRNEAGRIRHLERAQEIYAQYGSVILDDLELWKKFNDMSGLYARAKQHRRELKNLLNAAFNFKVQGLVANIISRATIAVAKAYKEQGLQAKVIANIHDELIVHCPVHEAEIAGKILQEKMENSWSMTVPMIAKPSFGQNFRDAKT